MSYIKYGVNLSDGQKDKLARALSNIKHYKAL